MKLVAAAAARVAVFHDLQKANHREATPDDEAAIFFPSS